VTIVDVVIPVRTVTGMNVREHPMARSRRVKNEKLATTTALIACGAPTHERLVRVLFVRVSPVLCDDDAIPPACKAIRDAVAKAFGVSDGPGKGITWTYDQAKGRRATKAQQGEHLVRLTIETEPRVTQLCPHPVEPVANPERKL
jgi:hypothetical protein